ncbi:MAG: sodium/solute symporter [Gemmatimonadota bacterium]|jgi:SSS family solute:Na+ symporter
MDFSPFDLTAFIGYFVLVAAVAIIVSRREKVAADYFLAGRNLPWWLIGISLIASNISTEQLVGQAGQGADFGLAVAAYEWMSAITLVIVARWFLPAFLANRVTTMPEYLERRFSVAARSWLAVYMILAYTFVAMATVLYSGGLALETMFGLPLWWGVTILAVFAGAYTAYGGLKAVVWSDLIQGTMLLLGGALTAWLGLRAVGGWDTLMEEAGDKFHMVLPLDHPELPWFAIFFGGLWIANLFYWGCNQFITQRTLGARNLKQGRYGIVFAAYLKLLIPFIAVVPGIMAYVLYADELTRSDMAYPVLIANLLPGGLAGLMLAALIAAIMSSLDSMLNSTATIFTVDVYQRHLKPESSQSHLIRVGRISTVAFLLLAWAWAPFLVSFERIFSYIQEFWGLITPGVAVVFLSGLFWKGATARGAVWVMGLTLPVTIGVKAVTPNAAFLDQMWVAGLVLFGLLAALSLTDPARASSRAQPDRLKESETTELADQLRERDWLFDALSIGAVVATVALVLYFW